MNFDASPSRFDVDTDRGFSDGHTFDDDLISPCAHSVATPNARFVEREDESFGPSSRGARSRSR